MTTKGTSFREVSFIHYAKDEQEKMAELNAIWVLTMDKKHQNVLVYPIDIMIEQFEEVYPKKYVNLDDCFEYEAENGSHWLISNSIEIDDLDEFFRNYLHLNADGIIAA